MIESIYLLVKNKNKKGGHERVTFDVEYSTYSQVIG